ncbi:MULTISPECIES: DUF2798 domain-containing protein [unclassified Rhizobium]|uniref:DUF2798 domain-containing protein n=1 Tax=unclassified Rhizobium TaxID=2613769 RepID=UPI001A996E9B|nr:MULTISPECIES: DUF2798 domain-containing protein [unclassified Rhizobium]MBX5183798.1 DUF2798 domain-containing protein [Rhizobium sp. NZLR5]MBX5195695.1 DUF2798 domain-containing protein [Rhizobium sp. NZLR10]MBX5202435.1 DUF2798 domain-containing protein [Rhizobium sp. NZLR1]QSZ23177.1 DUF2798 domain-containing protein [Rhizobium sp. NZLR1]
MTDRRNKNPRWKKLPAGYSKLLIPFVLSLMMSAIVSAVATGMSAGSGFFAHWPGAWAVSWLVAFPSLLMLMPLARWIVGVLVEPLR